MIKADNPCSLQDVFQLMKQQQYTQCSSHCLPAQLTIHNSSVLDCTAASAEPLNDPPECAVAVRSLLLAEERILVRLQLKLMDGNLFQNTPWQPRSTLEVRQCSHPGPSPQCPCCYIDLQNMYGRACEWKYEYHGSTVQAGSL